MQYVNAIKSGNDTQWFNFDCLMGINDFNNVFENLLVLAVYYKVIDLMDKVDGITFIALVKR